MPLDKKCELSHFVIDNSGALHDTEEEAAKIMTALLDSRHYWKMRLILMGTAALLCSGIAWLVNNKYKIMSS